MDWASADLEHCPLTRALDMLGKRWTLLILRELFNGVRRFDDLQHHLGASPSVLTRRLAEMVDDGLIERVPYRNDGERERHGYQPSDRALALQPVLIGLTQWGDRHLGQGRPPMLSLVDRATGAELVVGLVPADRPPPTADGLEVRWGGEAVDLGLR